jgi:hypothetical protein
VVREGKLHRLDSAKGIGPPCNMRPAFSVHKLCCKTKMPSDQNLTLLVERPTQSAPTPDGADRHLDRDASPPPMALMWSILPSVWSEFHSNGSEIV